MIEIIVGAAAVLAFLVMIGCAFAWYRVVPPSEAHLVVTPSKKMVCSPDKNVQKNGKSSYFAIPSSIPFIGRAVRMMDVTIKELVVPQETYEKNQARYQVKSSIKYRIMDVETASETFTSDQELKEMLKEVVQASVRAVTVKYDVTEARSNKQDMSREIKNEIVDDLKGWGLELVSFQLVDFQDTADSQIISNISKRREVEIESETRERNAEKLKQARIKEAEAEENARKREIERDEVIAKREQDKAKMVAEREKEAKEKEYEVIKVKTIKQAEIDKEKAIVLAEQNRETEKIRKEQKLLEGEGEKLKLEQVAIGNAADIREKGKAEAEAKDRLQAALNKFKDEAIRALVAEKIVEMQKEVGIKAAEALAKADMKIFAGGSQAQTGFDLGALIESTSVSNSSTAQAVLNRLSRPNDLGFGQYLENLKGKAADVDDNSQTSGKDNEHKASDAEAPMRRRK